MFQDTIGLNFLKSFGAGPHPPLSCLLWPSSCTSAQGIPGDPGRRDHSAGPQTPGAAGPAHLPESEFNTGNQNCCGNACPLFWSPRPLCSSSRHYISESFPSDAHDCCTSKSKLYTAQYLFLKLCLRFMLTKICGLGVEKVPSTKGKFSYFWWNFLRLEFIEPDFVIMCNSSHICSYCNCLFKILYSGE